MNANAFDPLRSARNLRDKAHPTPEQAEGMADAMAEVFASGIPTRTDITDVRHAFEAARLSIKADIATMKSDIIKWMFGMIVFQTVAILEVMVILVRCLP